MVSLVYTTYISVDLAHHENFRAKVCKGGIKVRPLNIDNGQCLLNCIKYYGKFHCSKMLRNKVRQYLDR